MEQEVEPTPCVRDLLEHSFQLSGLAYVAGHDDRRAERFRQRPDIRLGLGVDKGNGQFRPRVAEGARASIGDAVLVGHTDHEAALAGEIDDECHWITFPARRTEQASSAIT
jgi:hypothetical protein